MDMAPHWIAFLVLAFVYLSFWIGTKWHARLPQSHFDDDSKFVVELCIGMVAAMSALVLGLLTASTKQLFDEQDSAVKNVAALVLELNQTLKSYGQETAPIRKMTTEGFSHQIKIIWANYAQRHAGEKTTESKPIILTIESLIRSLQPKDEAQKEYRDRSLQILHELLKIRFHTMAAARGDIPTAFLVVMIFWLSVLFFSFGLYAPTHRTIFLLSFLSAVSVAAGIFIILEMGRPYSGLIKVSSAPVEDALRYIAQWDN